MPSNVLSTENGGDRRMLLTISAPSVDNQYYKEIFNEIIEFDINYAKSVLNNDNIVIVVDKKTKKYFQNKLPDDILLTGDICDIWMRDFTLINPFNPVQFKYSWHSMKKLESRQTQQSFENFAKKLDLNYSKTDYILDGGNIVDSNHGQVITTERFLDDNKLNCMKEDDFEKGKEILRNKLNATHVAIIQPDEPVLGHSDGMVMWIDEKTLVVYDYKSTDPKLYKNIMRELKDSFPNVKIIEVPFKPSDAVWRGFTSTSGININAVTTFDNIYIPTYNDPNHDQQFIDIIKTHATNKKVIPIPAEGIAKMGGSVRCLTYQSIGQNADKIIKAARLEN
jgi:agmatine/peptidylarginine deiminase